MAAAGSAQDNNDAISQQARSLVLGLRDLAKWLFAGLLGIAGAVLTASQFSHISAAKGEHFVYASVGALVAVAGVFLGLGFAIPVLTPEFLTLEDVEKLDKQNPPWLKYPQEKARFFGCDLGDLRERLDAGPPAQPVAGATEEAYQAYRDECEHFEKRKEEANIVYDNVVPLVFYYRHRQAFKRFTGTLCAALLLITTGLGVFTYYANYDSVGTIPASGPQVLNLSLIFNGHGYGIVVAPSSPSFRFLGQVTGSAFGNAHLLDKNCLSPDETSDVCKSSQVAKLRDKLSSSTERLEALLIFGSADTRDLKSSAPYKSNAVLAQARAMSVRDCLSDLISQSRVVITLVSVPKYFATGQSCADRNAMVYGNWETGK